MAFVDDQGACLTQPKFLDLLSLKPQFKDEVQNALYKLPEMKLRPEKISEEENIIKPESWKSTKRFPYVDPVPSSMLHVDIKELSTVDIDWKMLTLDRPETVMEINIFSRIVYLNKLMYQSIMKEKEKRDRLRLVRLRSSSRMKVSLESDNDKSDEFTYEYFSRTFSANDRGQAMEDVPKTPVEKTEPQLKPDDSNKEILPPETEKNSTIIALKRRKLPSKRKKKKKKKKKKPKLRKQKMSTSFKAAKTDAKSKNSKKVSAVSKSKTSKQKKVRQLKTKSINKLKKRKDKKSEPGKTLVQMLNMTETAEKKRTSK